MGIIISAELRNGPLSGYDVVSFIHNKFHLLVSSGTWNERKRVYQLTEKGRKTIETILSANDKIKNFITGLLKVQSTPNLLKSKTNRNPKKHLHKSSKNENKTIEGP